MPLGTLLLFELLTISICPALVCPTTSPRSSSASTVCSMALPSG